GRPTPGALSRSGMSNQGDDGQDRGAGADSDFHWMFRTSDNAVMLLDGDYRIVQANPAARALGEHALPGEGPEGLLALLPASAWEQARAAGRWAGEITVPSGIVLEIVVRNGHGTGDGID